MPARIVCLANSNKLRGRCLAGIRLDHKNRPRKLNDDPIWVRPISATEHGEIATDLVSHIQLLDVVEIELAEDHREAHQMEYYYFLEESLQVVDRFSFDGLEDLCETVRPFIFGNKHNAVHNDRIYLLHHSLLLVKPKNPRFFTAESERNPGKPKPRLSFEYKNLPYDFPITDPSITTNKIDGLSNVSELYVTLSLGLPYEAWNYKLVAGVMYR